MKIDFRDLRKIVVAIDPAGGHGEGSDDTGIVVVAKGPHRDETCKLFENTGRCAGHGYVLADLTCHVAPHEWARRAVNAYDLFKADRIVAEKNFGGEMVEETVHAIRLGVPLKLVTASRGKAVRAQPVAALWEQGRCHFAVSCPELEDELTTWTEDANWSPNRLDALVWGMSALGLIGGQGEAFMSVWKAETRDNKILNLETIRQEKIQRELVKIARNAPKRNRVRPKSTEENNLSDRLAPDQRSCQHRFRGDTCLFCEASQALVIALTR